MLRTRFFGHFKIPKVSKKVGFTRGAPNYKNFHFSIQTSNLTYFFEKPTYIWVNEICILYCISSMNRPRLIGEYHQMAKVKYNNNNDN